MIDIGKLPAFASNVLTSASLMVLLSILWLLILPVGAVSAWIVARQHRRAQLNDQFSGHGALLQS